MTLVIVLLVVLLLFVAVVLIDRVVVGVAEQRASDYLATPLGGPTSVRIRGTPFLSQAVRGRYRRIEITSGGLRMGDISGIEFVARLHNAYLPLRVLVSGGESELACEYVESELVIPYPELARLARVPGLAFSYQRERLMASAALPVPGISQLARVSGEAVLTVAGDGAVWLRVRGVAVAGIVVPSIALSQLLPSLTVPMPLPPLPYGLRLERLTPTPAGLAVFGAARAIALRRARRASD